MLLHAFICMKDDTGSNSFFFNSGPADATDDHF